MLATGSAILSLAKKQMLTCLVTTYILRPPFVFCEESLHTHTPQYITLLFAHKKIMGRILSCPSFYTKQCRECIDHVRAVLTMDERSPRALDLNSADCPRALDLTSEVTGVNFANYMADP